MNIRTDLITEQQESNNINLNGVESKQRKFNEINVSITSITTDTAAAVLEKPKGKYCTIEFPRLDRINNTDDIIQSTVKCLEALLPKGCDNALIVGLGNTDITPDALGPFTANGILATRHLSREFKESLGLTCLKSVSCLIPGVLGKTGIEAFDVIAATIEKTNPSVIIAIDALAARNPSRLCRTIQLSDSGICPGSGVNNSRKELSEDTFGIPVVAIGIPTVIDANSLFPQLSESPNDYMMVTPKDIDLLISKSASLLSRALNIFLQPELDIQIIESLT